MEDYATRFKDVADEAGYDGLPAVMKFRQGLNGKISEMVVGMGVNKPNDDNLEGWMESASLHDRALAQDRALKAALRSETTHRPAPP